MKSKEIVIGLIKFAVFILISLWIYFMVKNDKTLYLSGYLLPKRGFTYIGLSAIFLMSGLNVAWRFFKKNKAKLDDHTVTDLLGLIVYCFGIFVYLSIAVGEIKHAENYGLASEMLVLSDESKVLINECEIYSGRAEIQVYKIKGIIAKEIGTFSESSYFFDYCLKENKWDYTYSEADKMLTLTFRYDEPKDENDSGVREEKFTLD